jgi:NADP-dependent 3-hydroxy acid dehydrogenase YdfG
VAPGLVDTELQSHNTDPVVRRALETARERVGDPLQPDDIADAIVYAVTRPKHVCLNEVLVRPTGQSR